MVGKKIYVAVYFSDMIAAVDLEDKSYYPVKPIALGPEPQLTLVRRGQMYFHDADFCFQHWQSCSSCHPDARVDSLNWDLMNDGIGNPKNAKSMLLAHATPPVMALGVRADAETAVRAGIRHIQFAMRPEEDAAAIDASPADGQAQACSFNGFTGDMQLAERDTELDVLFYTARSGTLPDQELLTFDLYFPLGATNAVHDFTFTGESLADCHTCLQMRRDCSATSCISGRIFLAQEGTASVSQIGESGTNLQGTLTDIRLAEVTIGMGLETTLVPGGDTWCIDSYSFDQTITAP